MLKLQDTSCSYSCITISSFLYNSLRYDKFVDLPKFKPFADDKIYVTDQIEITLWRVENIVGKGGNASYQHFLLFP